MNALAHRTLNGARLAIFDADGTLRRTTVPGQPCPRAPHEWELLPGVSEVLSTMSWDVLRLGVASNQDQVGYGLISAEMAERLLRDLISDATGGRVTRPLVRFCPHRLEESCACRKPAPGMLLDLMREARVGTADTVFIGNAESDREAARRARCRFVWAADFFYIRQPGTACCGRPPAG